VTIGEAHASPAARVIDSFSHWWGVGIYTLAMFFLGMHLLHGIWGAAMTLGLNTSLRRAEQIRLASIVVTTIIVVGFLIPPFAILFGLVD
jgi:succinate dehydrogenase / fumarate reductase, cytochrome b subunit